MGKQELDFGKTDIRKLFVSMFVPTLIGMVFISVLNIADGIIVGQGIGSDALAAINICAPLYVTTTAIGLLFGSGVSVIAAVLLSKGNRKDAETCITQAILFPIVLMILVGICMVTCPRWLNGIFGGSDYLYPYVRDYMVWLMPMPMFLYICTAGGFVIRLDGSPKFAMWVTALPSCLNALLDWVLVFPVGMGIKGAAIATSLSLGIEATAIFIYLIYYAKTIRFVVSMNRWTKNLVHTAKMGFSIFVGEISTCVMIIIGNHMFMDMLQEDGVAAFSVACYLFPLIFMFGSSIAQSQMPIISYNTGNGDSVRVRRALYTSIYVAVVLGMLLMVSGILGSRWILLLFFDSSGNAYRIASEGFPVFSIGFLFITLNLMFSGYFQSLGMARRATCYTLLRGIVFMIPCFLILPGLIGDVGLWAAVPAAEILTLGFVLVYSKLVRINKQGI